MKNWQKLLTNSSWNVNKNNCNWMNVFETKFSRWENEKSIIIFNREQNVYHSNVYGRFAYASAMDTASYNDILAMWYFWVELHQPKMWTEENMINFIGFPPQIATCNIRNVSCNHFSEGKSPKWCWIIPDGVLQNLASAGCEMFDITTLKYWASERIWV